MNKHKFSRRNFLKMAGAVSASLTLTACGVKAAGVKPTDLPVPTKTTVPTATLTFTPTPVSPSPTVAPTMTPLPTVEVKVADLPQTKASVDQFAVAMISAGLQADAEQIRQGVTIKEITGKDGNKYEIVLTQDGYPLMIKGDSGWDTYTPKAFTQPSGISMGALTSFSRIEDNAEYRKVLLDNYSMVIIDGDLYPNKETMTLSNQDFSTFDATVVFLHGISVPLEFLHVVRDEWKWYPTSAKNVKLSPQEAERLLRLQVRKVMEKYKEAVSIWSVVNEAINGDGRGGFTSNPWYDAMGIDYIRVAFDEAKNVAPDATLMYNDFDLEKDNIKRAQVHTFLAPLIKSGLVNAVGVQMHFNGTHPPDRTKVLAALKDIGSWGVPVHITEFDVDMTDFPRTQAEKLLAQAKIYYEMMSAFLESGVGASFSTFGFTDLTSLYGTDKSDEALASMPLPFDSDLDPKAAYFAMLKATSEYLLAL